AALAPVSDIRWARLTRWRDLVAQFFDLPETRAAAWDRLVIAGADAHDARLLSGWLRSRLPGGRSIEAVHESGGGATLRSVRLSGTGGSLSVRLLPSDSCLETIVEL